MGESDERQKQESENAKETKEWEAGKEPKPAQEPDDETERRGREVHQRNEDKVETEDWEKKKS